MSRHARGLRGRTGGTRRPAAGRNRVLGLWRASQSRNVTPAAWLTRAGGRTGGRVQAIPLRSGVTAGVHNVKTDIALNIAK